MTGAWGTVGVSSWGWARKHPPSSLDWAPLQVSIYTHRKEIPMGSTGQSHTQVEGVRGAIIGC